MSSMHDHDAEQAAITAMCEGLTCDHPDCVPRSRIDYVCPNCGSRDIFVNATAVFNVSAQAWELSELVLQNCTEIWCGECGEDTSIQTAREVLD